MTADQQSFKPITSFALTQCTYGQPFAAISAYEQFTRQSAVRRASQGNATLIIVDSSPYPNEATVFYNAVMDRDERVHYFHIPHRPGRQARFDVNLAAAEYPNAYKWMEGQPFHEIYNNTMPTDQELAERYKGNHVVLETLHKYDPKAYAMFYGAVFGKQVVVPMNLMDMSDFNTAVDCIVQSHKLHNRPHLGSKRNFSYQVAMALGAKAAIHLDDDYLMPSYVDTQLEALKEAHFTAKTHYPVVIWTTKMVENGHEPIWAVSNLNHEGIAQVFDFEGNHEPDKRVKQTKPMGFTHAVRLSSKMPAVPDILGGEDRAYQRIVAQHHSVMNIQTAFDPSVIRLIFGRSNSVNVVKEAMLDGDSRLPPPHKRGAVHDYIEKLSNDTSSTAYCPGEPIRGKLQPREQATATAACGDGGGI